MIIPSLSAIPTPTFNAPTPSFTNIKCSANVLATLLGQDATKFKDISCCRTTASIVMGCLSTIFACTWITLHMDVPESNQTTWKSWWWNLRGMLWALIAPELVAAQAVNECLGAKRNMDDWNANFVALCSPELVEIPGKTTKQYERELKEKEYDSRWTLMHGFLAHMGGMRFYGESQYGGYHRKFKPTIMIFKDPKMRPIIQEIGLISPTDIEDKSKGDLLCRFFVAVQTTWFIVQCLARWATRLPVTELEVVTLAYVVLNIFIYCLWWKKPQGLSIPYRFYLDNGEDENLEGEDNTEQESLPFMRHSPSPTFAHGAIKASKIFKSETRCRRCHKGVKGSLTCSCKWVKPALPGVDRGFFKGLRVDSALFSFTLIGFIFGGPHLIAIPWLPAFPSNVEKILWGVSAFLITALPSAIVISEFVIANRKRKSTLISLDIELAIFKICLMSVYSILRITLAVLTFTTLRSLPPEALLNVEWTRFIPHF